jgi:hypothetical protein
VEHVPARVVVSNPTFANSLTISNAAAGHYALVVITIAAAIFTAIVLLYQSWTYYAFRKRLGREQTKSRAAALADNPLDHDDRTPSSVRRCGAAR